MITMSTSTTTTITTFLPPPHRSTTTTSSSSSSLSDKRSSDFPPTLDRKEEEKEEEEEGEEITTRANQDSMTFTASHTPSQRRHSTTQPSLAVCAARGTPGDFNTADARLLGPAVSPCSCGASREDRETNTLSTEADNSRHDNDNTWITDDEEAALLLLNGEEEGGNKWSRKKRRRERKRNEEIISEGSKRRPCGTPLCAAVILSLLSTASGEC